MANGDTTTRIGAPPNIGSSSSSSNSSSSSYLFNLIYFICFHRHRVCVRVCRLCVWLCFVFRLKNFRVKFRLPTSMPSC